MDCMRGAPVRDHLRGVVSALDLRAAEDPVGTDVVPTVAGFREVDTHMVFINLLSVQENEKKMKNDSFFVIFPTAGNN